MVINIILKYWFHSFYEDEPIRGDNNAIVTRYKASIGGRPRSACWGWGLDVYDEAAGGVEVFIVEEHEEVFVWDSAGEDYQAIEAV